VNEADAAMPPPAETQCSLKRKRGRPPKTPTKGPVEKQIKASAASCHDAEDATVAPTQGRQVVDSHLGTACPMTFRLLSAVAHVF